MADYDFKAKRERDNAARSAIDVEAAAPLTAVLAWPALPAVLRRALSRAVPPETLASLSFGESVQAWRDPALPE